METRPIDKQEQKKLVELDFKISQLEKELGKLKDEVQQKYSSRVQSGETILRRRRANPLW